MYLLELVHVNEDLQIAISVTWLSRSIECSLHCFKFIETEYSFVIYCRIRECKQEGVIRRGCVQDLQQGHRQ